MASNSEEHTARILAEKVLAIETHVTPDEGCSAEWFGAFKYFTCNEDYIHHGIPAQLETLRDRVHGEIHVAIIVGEGHFLSLTPIFARKINLVVFYDINPKLISHVKVMVESMRCSENIEEFYKNYAEAAKPLFGEGEEVPTLELMRKSSMHYVRELSFLKDEERFAECKKHLEHIEVTYFCANLLNLEHVKQLTECLAGSNSPCSIELLNITNLQEYCKTPLEKEQLQTSIHALTPLNPSEEEKTASMILYSGLYTGDFFESLGTLGTNAKYVSQGTRDPDITKMTIAQHETQKLDPFDPYCSFQERFQRMQAFSDFIMELRKRLPSEENPHLPPEEGNPDLPADGDNPDLQPPCSIC